MGSPIFRPALLACHLARWGEDCPNNRRPRKAKRAEWIDRSVSINRVEDTLPPTYTNASLIIDWSVMPDVLGIIVLSLIRQCGLIPIQRLSKTLTSQSEEL